MALNPFFLHGTSAEQRLVQELVNEQLRMYGVEIVYIPRKFVNVDKILKEVSSSIFDDIFPIEAYVNSYDGHLGSGDIMTKFGVSIRDELVVTISRERFEDFISPFLAAEPNESIDLYTRPREGDLIYFPLDGKLFEVKFVEHENPFYQLGKLYVYELRCEVFEYEDEVIDTSVEEIDTQVQTFGNITTLNLVGFALTERASLLPSVNTGFINKIYLNSDGYGYVSTPTISITKSPIIGALSNATAVAITTNKNGIYSIKEIVLTNAGYGYTVPPRINIIAKNGGAGAAATCSIETEKYGVVSILVDSAGQGYVNPPSVVISDPPISGITATAYAVVDSQNKVSSVRITNPGIGYTTSPLPIITVSNPQNMTGIGTYLLNEIVVGSATSASAWVKSWDVTTNTLDVSIIEGSFAPGEVVVGSISSARYLIEKFVDDNVYDKYSQNEEIEQEADSIIDFTESNPFGVY